MNLEAILRRHARSSVLFDAEPVKDSLLTDLRTQRRFTSVLYAVLFGAVCLAFVLAIAALSFDLVKVGANRSGVVGAVGVGVPAVLEWMRRVVREWSRVGLLMALVSHSDEATIQNLIHKLIESPDVALHAPTGARGGT